MTSADATAVKERPIIFSAEMVRAILKGRKTQTRRVIKTQPPAPYVVWGEGRLDSDIALFTTYPRQGEKGNPIHRFCPYGQKGNRLWVREAWFCATGEPGPTICYYRASDNVPEVTGLWISPIHMPRWASRITLEITGVRVERVQDISEDDTIAEGMTAFARLWDSINAKRGYSWDSNPWVWVIEFKRMEVDRNAGN